MGECGRNSVLCLFMQQSVQVHLCNPCRLPYYVQIFIQDMRHPKDSVPTFITAINIARFVRKVREMLVNFPPQCNRLRVDIQLIETD